MYWKCQNANTMSKNEIKKESVLKSPQYLPNLNNARYSVVWPVNISCSRTVDEKANKYMFPSHDPWLQPSFLKARHASCWSESVVSGWCLAADAGRDESRRMVNRGSPGAGVSRETRALLMQDNISYTCVCVCVLEWFAISSCSWHEDESQTWKNKPAAARGLCKWTQTGVSVFPHAFVTMRKLHICIYLHYGWQKASTCTGRAQPAQSTCPFPPYTPKGRFLVVVLLVFSSINQCYINHPLCLRLSVIRCVSDPRHIQQQQPLKQ